MVVGGHQVAIALSPTRTVLWDQIAYSGAPEDFAWVMPVPAGARVEVAASAWLEALDARTTTQVSSQEILCFDDSSGGGCGMGAAAGGVPSSAPAQRGPSVTVVHEGTVGPYQTATLKSTDPGGVAQWLTENGYKLPADIKPLLDDYTAQGRDFIALRLKPDTGIRSMRPVRVIMPGAITTFPMRMLSAGAGAAVALKVFVITEGRVQVEGFPGAEISAQELTWDFSAHTSNYDGARKDKLSGEGGTTWLTSYTRQDPFFSPATEPSYYEGGDRSQSEGLIADAYFTQAAKTGEGSPGCIAGNQSGMTGKVVDLCPPEGGACGAAGENEIDAQQFECDGLKDLSAALIGLHPADVWLTRFEAELPRAALTRDLSFVPAAKQERVPNLIVAANNENAPECAAGALLPSEPTGRSSLPRGPQRGIATLGLAASALAFAITRRLSRARPGFTLVRT